MALLLEKVYNQKVYPSGRPSGQNEGEAKDVDDCWVVSTVMAAIANAPWAVQPTIREFRTTAGDPDDNIRDGGSVDEVHKGAIGTWPTLNPQKVNGWDFEKVLIEIKKLRPFSAMADSRKLPLSYGHKSWHQVVIFHEPGVGLYIANPLAKNGSKPTRIPVLDAKKSLESYGNGKVYGELFPTPADAAKVRPQETEMRALKRRPGPFGSFSVKSPNIGYYYLDLVTNTPKPAVFVTPRTGVTPVRLVEPLAGGKPGANRSDGFAWYGTGSAGFMLESDVDFTPVTPGATPEQVQAAVKAAVDAEKKRVQEILDQV